jgi:hypothetical protein
MNIKHTLVALAALACAAAAQANIVTVTGALTTTDPSFNRPIEDLSSLSSVGDAVRYDVVEFTVGTAGEYTFMTTAMFDSFALLYAPTFSASSPLTNALIANDDLLGQTTSGFTFTLATNTVYRYVTTGFGNTDLGNYSTTIGGIGTISMVPEASSYAMLALGLGVLGLIARRKAR